MTKAKTMDIKGNAYAKVAERLLLFREQNPRGKTISRKTETEDNIEFTCYVWKDKVDAQYHEGELIVESADANGSASGAIKGDKNFEKLETVALGRALAMLGYAASGDIASGEEMEEFYAYKDQKKEEAIINAIDKINDAKTVDELRDIFISLGGLIAEEKVQEAKDTKKEELQREGNKG